MKIPMEGPFRCVETHMQLASFDILTVTCILIDVILRVNILIKVTYHLIKHDDVHTRSTWERGFFTDGTKSHAI